MFLLYAFALRLLVPEVIRDVSCWLERVREENQRCRINAQKKKTLDDEWEWLWDTWGNREGQRLRMCDISLLVPKER